MDVKIFTLCFLLWNAVAGLGNLDNFSDLLIRKYSANISHLSVSELENLWVRLLLKNDTTSTVSNNGSSRVSLIKLIPKTQLFDFKTFDYLFIHSVQN